MTNRILVLTLYLRVRRAIINTSMLKQHLIVCGFLMQTILVIGQCQIESTEIWNIQSYDRFQSYIGDVEVIIDVSSTPIKETQLEDIDDFQDNKKTGTLSISFSEPVTDLTIHYERIGGVGSAFGAQTGISNSVQWTANTPGITLQKPMGTGTDNFIVTPTYVMKESDLMNTLPNGEATQEKLTGSASGSIELISNSPISFVEFEWTGVGGDELELVISARGISVPCCMNPDYDALVAFYHATDGPNWTNTWDITDCDFCEWHGVGCDENGRVNSLVLIVNNLSGTIPAEIGNLTNLRSLFLYINELTGTIPIEIGNLTELKYLSLQNNQLSGSIPSQIGNLTKLTSVGLYDNNLTGEIPTEIENLTNITSLSLNHNQLSGSIPTEIENLTKLTSLRLNNNQLSGSIPAEIENLVSLEYLWLDHNQLSGVIPIEIGNLTNLTSLNLRSNQLIGNIPFEIKNLINLDFLWAEDNQISGSIPTGIGDLVKLKSLNLGRNMITGSIPNELGNLEKLINLFLGNNQLSGNIPEEIGNLSNLNQLSLYNNELSGSIPVEIGNLKNTLVINVSNNRLAGNIPIEIGHASNLRVLDLGGNRLDGVIPSEIENLTKLSTLILDNNRLVGGIPIEIGNLHNLTYILVRNNLLSGCYPIEFLSTFVNYCELSNNNISDGNNFDATWEDFCNSYAGACPTPCGHPDYNGLVALYNATYGPDWINTWDTADCDICDWYGVTCHPDGRVKSISLGFNNLIGTLPVEIGSIRHIEDLSIQNNYLQGPIPQSIGNLTDLHTLSLRGNQLTGEIPLTMGNLTELDYLFLQQNQLTGSIPRTFSELSNLFLFNVSNNNLSGCFHPSLKESLCSFENSVITEGNTFVTEWTDACLCSAGLCPCAEINEWKGATGDWDYPFSWSLNHPPLECEVVVIPNSDDVVIIPEYYQATIYTLEVSGGAQLIIPESSELTVLTDKQFVISDGCN